MAGVGIATAGSPRRCVLRQAQDVAPRDKRLAMTGQQGPRWRIWYADGSSFSDLDGAPHEAPGRGVQVIIQADPRTGRRGICEYDYYIWKADQWFGVDLFGLWDYLSRLGLKVVKFGEYIDRAEFEAVLRMAEADQSMPQRSAWLPTERRASPSPTLTPLVRRTGYPSPSGRGEDRA